MKKSSIAIVGGILMLGVIAFIGATKIAHGFLGEKPTAAACQTPARIHKIIIAHNSMSPATIRASRCDTLLVTNVDPQTRRIAFGEHNQHVAYSGTTETMLSQGQSFDITLAQPGAFKVHDHFDKNISATFTVAQ